MAYARPLETEIASGAVPWATVLVSLVIFAGTAALSLRKWREAPTWLLVPALALAAVSYFGAIGAGPAFLDVAFGERYTFVPQVLIGFSLIAFAATRTGFFSRICGAACVLMIVVGIATFVQFDPLIADGPDWRAEVASWRADPEHRLATWPDGWFVDLSPIGAECPSASDAAAHPGFCYEYWERQDMPKPKPLP